MSPDDGTFQLFAENERALPASTRGKVLSELKDQVAYIHQSSKDHSYSRGVPKLFDLLLSYSGFTEDAALQGKPVMWLNGMHFSPALYAAGIIPRGCTELGRIGSADAIPIADDLFQLPKEACSMIATMVGELYLRRDSAVKEVVVYCGSCEPMILQWELVREYGYRIHRIEGVFAPQEGDEERRRQVVEFAAQQFRDVIVEISGKPVDETRLSAELARSNRLTRKLARVLDLRIKNPYYLRSLATTILIEGNMAYYGRPDEFEEVLDLLIEELETADIVPPPKGKVIPIAWIGHRGQEFGIYKAVDDGGGVLFFDAPGVGAEARLWREDLPPLDALGDFLTGAWGRGNWKGRFKVGERIIEKTGAKGLILYTYIGCTFGGFHNEIEREHYQKLGLPALNLEGSFQIGPVHGQVLTRVRAFIEMLS